MTTHARTDKNFDPLVDTFRERIYGSMKGDLRLHLLKEDLSALHQGPRLNVWDAGCGLGQMTHWFAQGGHRIIACDVSEKMLAQTRAGLDAQAQVELIHAPAQQVAKDLAPQDLVVFHAVLEWLADPCATLSTVAEKVKPGGHLSLLFYNYHAVAFLKMVGGQGRIEEVLTGSFYGKSFHLTPPHPQKPEAVAQWLHDWGFDLEVFTGIRCFHDFTCPERLAATDPQMMFQAECFHARQEPYRQLARYVHFLAKRRDN